MPPMTFIVRDVDAARRGDLAAFARLVEATRQMAYAVAWRVVRKDEDARDVVQEAYLAAFRRLGELSQPEAFPGWLRRIVVSKTTPAASQGPGVDGWWFAGRILEAVDRVLPRAEVRVSPTDHPMCARAWSLDVRHADGWIEVLAWGEYAEWVMRAIGADPARHVALGAGFGLDRLAALRYAIDDVRKIATTRLEPSLAPSHA